MLTYETYFVFRITQYATRNTQYATLITHKSDIIHTKRFNQTSGEPVHKIMTAFTRNPKHQPKKKVGAFFFKEYLYYYYYVTFSANS